MEKRLSVKDKLYKKVLLPIEVSYGDFCWGEGRLCGHFSNEGGCPMCDFFKYGRLLEYDEEGRIPKLAECRDLKEAKEDEN